MNWFEKIKNVCSICVGFLSYYLGGIEGILTALISLVCIDYITGVLKAVHDRQLSSAIGMKGILKKVAVFVLVATAQIVQGAVGGEFPLRDCVVIFFISNEAISIVENVAAMGLPIPQSFTRYLKQIGEDSPKEPEDEQ